MARLEAHFVASFALAGAGASPGRSISGLERLDSPTIAASVTLVNLQPAVVAAISACALRESPRAARSSAS
jgi:hypothetical protein